MTILIAYLILKINTKYQGRIVKDILMKNDAHIMANEQNVEL